MDAICPTAIDSLVRIWTTLHADLSVEIEPAEVRHLHRVVFGMDDELLACLLATKLAMSRRPRRNWPGDDLARFGSEILFSVQGRQHRGRLIHGAADEAGVIGIESRYGAALLGLRSGQQILWPHASGRLVEVRVLEVTAPRILGRPDCAAGRPGRAAPCASG